MDSTWWTVALPRGITSDTRGTPAYAPSPPPTLHPSFPEGAPCSLTCGTMPNNPTMTDTSPVVAAVHTPQCLTSDPALLLAFPSVLWGLPQPQPSRQFGGRKEEEGLSPLEALSFIREGKPLEHILVHVSWARIGSHSPLLLLRLITD